MEVNFSCLLICMILLRFTGNGGFADDVTTPDPTINNSTYVEPFVYQEGYVFEEPVGEDCVKWGNYMDENDRESVEDFRNRCTVNNGKKINENCDSSRIPGECEHPLQCVNDKCQCTHKWRPHENKCEISPQWDPKSNPGPGCIESDDCVESAECFLQYPCHCTGGGKCNVVYGKCICAHPYPPQGFRDGNCERTPHHDRH